jgi:hypothetical protein
MTMTEETRKRKRPFRSVRHEGGSVVLTIEKDLLPADWKVVTTTKVSADLTAERPSILLKIEKVS